ncbi:MFS transporter [Telmatospirillum sp.]|uniref:MFS transporter n=1 Tax=Telmatospirillum sp. TaxID=2079197 RepID=UPI0028419C24|nr:MFS transporter [Telmatospirillum sp.]MDR3436859.1 MFS transporter [Telmatospirillum sp.]
MTEVSADQRQLKQDSLTIGLVSLAHLMSHFFQLCWAPLFPRLHDAFAVNYLELGSVATAFYLTSGISQAFAGILVDRYGARPMLLIGITSMAASIGLSGLVSDFWMLYPLAILAGAGNSVFHPADFSVLSLHVSKQRLGRAYGVHSFSGTLGWALAPVLIGGLAAVAGWRVALVVAGLAGLLVVALLVRFNAVLADAASRDSQESKRAAIPYARLIASPAIMMAFGYFLLTAAAGTGFQTFSTSVFVELYGILPQTATSALTAYLIGSAIGILMGGQLADHTNSHSRVAIAGLLGCAFLILLVASGLLSFVLTTTVVFFAGLAQGITSPSRDILVKMATPPGATGKVFGFVYSGLDAGSTVAPLMFGAFLDRHAIHAIFVGIALLYALSTISVLTVGRSRANS